MSKTKDKTAIHGIRGKDMAEAILPLVRRTSPMKHSTTTLVFTIYGEHDEFVDEYGNPDPNGFPLLYDLEERKSGKITPADTLKNAYAKVVYNVQSNIRGSRNKYYVKRSNAGKFFNPIGMYTEGRHNKQLKHAGVDEWTFKEVAPNIFIMYLNFLKSRNIAWLLNCEREVM